MRFELFVGLKYLYSKKLVTIISIIVVAVGVMTLIAVLSVINGFQVTIREKIVNTGFHIYITTLGLDSFLKNHEEIIKTVSKYGYFKLLTPFFRSQAIIRTSATRLMAIELFGIEPLLHQKDPDFRSCVEIKQGKFDLSNEKYILIGDQLKDYLGVRTGDTIEIIAPHSHTESGSIFPVLKKYTVKGIFKSGFYEYDLKYAFISLKSAQSLFGRKNEVWGIGVRIDDVFDANRLASKLRTILKLRYRVFTWADVNRNLFEALKNEKALLSFVVFLIIVVAALGIASTLLMIVLEKKREIGILKAFGATNNQIRSIFLFDGGITGAIGTLLGLISGILLSKNLEKVFLVVEHIVNFVRNLFYHILRLFLDVVPPLPFQVLSEDVYYFERLPVVIKFEDVFFVCLGAILVSIIFSVIPASKAGKLNPVEAIRHE